MSALHSGHLTKGGEHRERAECTVKINDWHLYLCTPDTIWFFKGGITFQLRWTQKISLMFSGHLVNVEEQSVQLAIWPHGKNKRLALLSLHTLHKLPSSRLLFSLRLISEDISWSIPSSFTAQFLFISMSASLIISHFLAFETLVLSKNDVRIW